MCFVQINYVVEIGFPLATKTVLSRDRRLAGCFTLPRAPAVEINDNAESDFDSIVSRPLCV